MVLRGLAVLLVLKVAIVGVLNWPDYFPPNFRSDFLLGRRNYFFGWYRWAFYAHVVAGPVSLVAGLLLLSDRLRRWRPAWHRRLGRLQVVCVAAVVAPTGLAMAYHAQTGAVAASGFATASLLTLYCVVRGWRAAVGRRFGEHQLWMQRCFAMLCSAVAVRVIGGASEWAGLEGTYPFAAWFGWLAPLAALEGARRITRRSRALRPRL